jgi:DNA/RNA-binding domain of Phe-tRNA-synthetase-like protein
MVDEQEGHEFPPQVIAELSGWQLWWAELERIGGCEEELARARTEVAARARTALKPEELAEHPTAAAIRKLFRQVGCDPTRYRPSSEALLRRVLKGEDLPVIHPLVDVNNCLSIELVVPACVVAVGATVPPFTLRAGRVGESMESMRGPFDLAGKPLLADREGPFGTPITDAQRVKVQPSTARAWLVAYLPAGVVTSECAAGALRMLLRQAPVARLGRTGASG